MATIACEIFHRASRADWVGFYRVVAPGLLKVGPYQGGHGCLVIPSDRGVCGAAARERRTQVVADADAFPGHIACSSSTRSEIVVPVFDGRNELIAVLDIDSDRPAAFGKADAAARGAHGGGVQGRRGGLTGPGPAQRNPRTETAPVSVISLPSIGRKALPAAGARCELAP